MKGNRMYVDIGTIEACRKYMAQMSAWLDGAEDSARAVAAREAVDQ